MQEASLCRRIFAESKSGLKPPTVGRIGARARHVSRRSLPRWWCGQRVEGGAKGAITAFAVRCPVRRAGLCGRLHLPTQLLITGERHWRSLPRSAKYSPIVSPARLMLVGGSSVNNIYADAITGKDDLSSCWPLHVLMSQCQARASMILDYVCLLY